MRSDIQQSADDDAFQLQTAAYGHIVHGMASMCLPKLSVLYMLMPLLLAINHDEAEEPEAAEEGTVLH